MGRDWDKLRRERRARAPLSRSQEMGRAAVFRKAKRKHFRRINRINAIESAERRRRKTTYKPIVERELSIESPQGTSRAMFRRVNGCWHCTAVNNPKFEWFLRVRHLGLIKQWLINHRYEYHWILQGKLKNGPADEHPTDPMLNKHCAVSSLNNQNPVVTWECPNPSATGLDRNGVTTSSPVNASA